VVVIKAQIIM